MGAFETAAAGVTLATAWVQLMPSFKGVESAITKEFSGVNTEKVGREAGSRFVGGVDKGLVKLGTAIVGAFAVKAVANFFSESLDAVKNWQVLNAQTAAVVKSTGGAANVTADQVHKLAQQLEGMTATQAESIQSGANMLLTFKNISNGVGEGNDIFNQATAALVDMTRAMGTDPQTAAIQLGKALNDPIQGISALTRVGITFSDDQKRLIQTMVESGDVMGAQKIILAELNAEFGGSGAAYAETYAGKIYLLGDAFGDIGEELVTNLMPNLTELIDWLREDGITAIEDFADGISSIFEGIEKVSEQDWYQDFMDSLGEGGELDLVGGGFVDNLKNKWAELPASFQNGWNQIKEANDQGSAAIEQWWNEGWAALPGKAQTGWEQITGAFANGWTQITTWWNTGWDGLVTKLATGREQINAGLTWLWEQIVGAFANGWTQITTWWTSLWTTVWSTLTTWATEVSETVATFISGVVDRFVSGWNQIVQFVRGVAQTITDTVNNILATFQRVADGIRAAFDGIGQFIRDAFGPIMDFIGGVGQNLANFFGGMGDRARYVKGRLADMAANRVAFGGSALARVRATLPAGLRITDTISSPARDRALGLVRSANSYHYDAANPAVDIAGPTWLLDQYYRVLVSMGPWRQLLWRVPGHYDHIHVAHSGGQVSPAWPRLLGDRADERTVRLQVGETVLPRGFGADGGELRLLSQRMLVLRVGEREFTGYLDDRADARIEVYDSDRRQATLRGYRGGV